MHHMYMQYIFAVYTYIYIYLFIYAVYIYTHTCAFVLLCFNLRGFEEFEVQDPTSTLRSSRDRHGRKDTWVCLINGVSSNFYHNRTKPTTTNNDNCKQI